MSDKRRVLIIVEDMAVPFDRRVWQEAKALDEAGYWVTIICCTAKEYPRRHEVLDGIEIFRHTLPLEARSRFAFLIEFAAALFWETILTFRVFVSHGFDVIHACNPPDLIFLTALPYKVLLRKKFVFDHHDISPELYVAKFARKDFFYYLLVALEWLTFKTADASIATNESYREIALRRGGMNPDHVFIVRSGPDLNRLRIVPADPALKGRFKYLVGYVGVMGQQEGLSYLLRAIHHIVYNEHREDVRFVLIGSGPELPLLKKEVTQLGIDHYVVFTGRVSDAELNRLLCSCDVCVNPDEANHMNDLSTMNKIMEYMALAKPIVQFDLKEGRVSAQDASLYAERNDPVDFARKIVELLDNPALRARMSERGRQRVESVLAWHHQKANLLACYEQLFSDG